MAKINNDVEKLPFYADLIYKNGDIDKELYNNYKVYRGLRDINGRGILAGLTKISDIVSYIENEDGSRTPCEGKLYYRGFDIKKLVSGFMSDDRFGFEETAFLLLFGQLPTKEELEIWQNTLGKNRKLPHYFVRDVIMKAPTSDIMNALARSVLTLYSYDNNPNDTSIQNVLNQSIGLISRLPSIAVYSYLAHKHYHDDSSLFIHNPQQELSTAENILYMLRPDCNYTKMEAKILDLALVLHAEHGGGNNSTFTMHVVSSSGTDTYSATAAALGSLKGPKHGGANIKVVEMFDELKKHVKDFVDEEQVEHFLRKMLHKEVYDKSGLIYGMGHAVYSLSDPRAQVLEEQAEKLALEKNRLDEFKLYKLVNKLAPKVIAEERRIYKGVSPNVDFFSGFCYDMLDLPAELYTPLFAIARMVGWSAHRLEELENGNKIIRPAYKAVDVKQEYKNLSER